MLSRTASEAVFQGGEGASVFPIPFPFLENAHLEVEQTGPDGSERLQAGIDYMINRISDGNGELVLLGTDLPPDQVLTIRRTVPLTQEILFHNQGPNSPKATEESLDKLTMIAQQLQRGIEGRMPVPENLTAEEAMERLAEALGAFGALSAEVTGVQDALGGKADSGHQHRTPDIADLAEKLDAKAGRDDPRLSDARTPVAHAASHSLTGADRLRPEDIGTLSPPPGDGKSYLATGGGWIEYIPVGSGGEPIGDHSLLQNRDAADQHPQSAIQHLAEDMTRITTGLDGLNTAVEAIETALDARAPLASPAFTGTPTGPTAAAGTSSSQLATTAFVAAQGYAPLASPGFSGAPTAPTPLLADNSTRLATTAYVRAAVGSMSTAILGEIRLWPFRIAELPFGWHFPSGQYYALTSDIGQVLNSFSATFKSDWGIAVSGSSISLCGTAKFFAGALGRFFRAVNGSNRQPGSVENYATVNITGTVTWAGGQELTGYTGAFYKNGATTAGYSHNASGYSSDTAGFSASQSIGSGFIASEVRPYNVGMIPAIYLGV